MDPSVHVDLYVTNVEKEGAFLKIWGQRDQTAATNVECLIEQHHEKFVKGVGEPDPQSVVPDQLFCAPFKDGRYYRARVVQVDLANGLVSCIFIDYGNRETLKIEDLRIPEKEQALYRIPAQASSFILADVVGSWEQQAIDLIMNKIGYETLPCQLLKCIGPQNQKTLVKLFFESRDFAEQLVNWGLATRVPQQTFEVMVWTALSAQAGPVSTPVNMANYSTYQTNPLMALMTQFQLQNMMGNPNMIAPVATSPVISTKHIMSPPQVAPLLLPPSKTDVPALTRFSALVLENNLDHRVCVTYVEKGTFSFSVQPEKCFNERDKMMSALNSPAISFSHLKPPFVPGTICLAKSCSDGSMYRAVITGIEDTKCVVYYVDYGNSEALGCHELFDIPPAYTHPKVMALQFTLAGLKDVNSTDEMKQIFSDIVSEQYAILRIVQPKCEELCTRQLGELFINDTNVKELLNVELLKKRQKSQPKLNYHNMQLPETGSKVKVVVAYVKSLSNFYVQLASKQNDLDSVMADVALHCNGPAKRLSASEVQPGTVCCALYTEDDQWYRALVLNADQNDLTVMYVDYGNEEKVTLDNLRTADPNLVTKLRGQAIPCRLSGFDGRDNDKDLLSRFEEIALENTFMMHVVQLLKEVPCVVVRLINELGNDIATLIDTTPTPKTNGHAYESSQKSSVASTKIQSDSSVRQSSEDWKSKGNVSGRSSKLSDNYQSDSPHQKPSDACNNYGRDSYTRSRVENGSDRGSERDSSSRSRYDREPQSSRGTGDRNFKSGGSGRRDDQEDVSSYLNCPKKNPKAWGIEKNGTQESPYGHCDRDCDERSRDYDEPRERDSRGGLRGRESSRSQGNAYKEPASNNAHSRGYRSEPQDSCINAKATAEGAWDDSPSAVSIQELVVPVGCKKPVFVVFSNSPSDFYLHERPTNSGLENLMDQISNQYSAGGDPLPTSSVSVGTVCVAKYSEDDAWYRAVIQKVSPKTVEVLFLDYGNTQTVDYKDLKVIKSDMACLPRQAIHCMLMGISSTGWSDDQLSEFSKLLDSESLEAEFVEKKDNVYRVVLQDSTNIINLSFGATAQSLISPTSIVTSVSHQNLELGSSHEILVSWFVNPHKFYVQLRNSQDQFKSMMQNLQKEYKDKSCLPSPSIGQTVVARFKKDNALYRAEVKIQKGDKYGIQFIDYGNRSLVDSSSIYGLEHQFACIPSQAIECSLKGVLPLEATWAKDNSEMDKSFHGKIICTFHNAPAPNCGETPYVVSLSRDGLDLAQELIDKQLVKPDVLPTSSTEESSDDNDTPVDLQLLVGQLVPAFVEYIEDQKLFVSFEPNSIASKREEVVQCIQQTKNLVHLPSEKVIPGQLCLAPCQVSNEYQRAVLLDCKSTAGIVVQFIDFGLSEEVPCDKLQVLPDEVASIPALLTACVVDNVQSDSDIMSLNQQNVILAVKSCEGGRLQVDVLDSCGQSLVSAPSQHSINSTLIPMPLIRQKIRVSVSHASGSAVWLQQVQLDDKLSELLDEMFESHEEVNEPLQSTSVGTLCAAKSVLDDNWYRAEIESEPCAEGVVVRYLDYGNSETVPLDNLKVLKEKFRALHALAVKASLPIISEDLTLGETILEKTSDKTFNAIFVKDKNWLVELLDGQSALSADLVLTGKALTMENNPFPALLTEPVCETVLTPGSSHPGYVAFLKSASEFYVQLEPDISRLEKMQEDLQTLSHCMKAFEVYPEVGTMCMALYTEDGVWYRGLVMPDLSIFFVDYGNSENIELSNLKVLPPAMEQIKNFAVKCCLQAPENKKWSDKAFDRLTELVVDSGESVVVSVISQIGDMRVVALSLSSVGNVADLLIKDGSLEELDTSGIAEFKVILTAVTSPSDFMVRHVGKNNEEHCALYLPSHITDWSPAAISHFKDLATGGTTEFTMDTLIAGDPLTVSLTLNGRKIDQELVALCSNATIDDASAVTTATVVFANSPADFYIHLSKDNEAIEEMANSLAEAGSYDVCEDTSVNVLCAALFPSDDSWYRAKIIGEEPEGVDVLFIDYGNTAVTSELRSLPQQLQTIPPLALRCSLPTPVGLSGWSDAATEKFEEMIADGETVFQIEILSSEEPFEVSLHSGDLDVSQELSKLSGNVPEEITSMTHNTLDATCESQDEPQEQSLESALGGDSLLRETNVTDNTGGDIHCCPDEELVCDNEVSQSGIEEHEAAEISDVRIEVPVEDESSEESSSEFLRVPLRRICEEDEVEDSPSIENLGHCDVTNAPENLEDSVVEIEPVSNVIPVITLDDSIVEESVLENSEDSLQAESPQHVGASVEDKSSEDNPEISVILDHYENNSSVEALQSAILDVLSKSDANAEVQNKSDCLDDVTLDLTAQSEDPNFPDEGEQAQSKSDCLDVVILDMTVPSEDPNSTDEGEQAQNKSDCLDVVTLDLTVPSEDLDSTDGVEVDPVPAKLEDLSVTCTVVSSSEEPKDNSKVVVLLTSYPSAKLCESDTDGTSHGQCEAQSIDFLPEFHQGVPGLVTYTFHDCEEHRVSVEVTSSGDITVPT